MQPYTLNDVKTCSANTVSTYMSKAAATLYGDKNAEGIQKLFITVDSLYAGRHPDYHANDTAYHDLEHTLQVTLCFARMMEGFNEVEGTKISCAGYFINGIAACLLHDAGYLKDGKDGNGTGAKFTLVHESRSCNVASIVLKDLGWDDKSIQSVQRLISATGPNASIDVIPFCDSCEKMIAQMVATADFIAQVSDPEYVNKLPKLYEEFEEFDQTRGLAQADRDFPNLNALILQTPDFWNNFVLPRLKNECNGFYRYLSVPYPDGPNPYIIQAEKNIATILENSAK